MPYPKRGTPGKPCHKPGCSGVAVKGYRWCSRCLGNVKLAMATSGYLTETRYANAHE